jgi:hypothetical protein
MSAREKKCIFCGRVGTLTAEHIWGDWTKQYVPRSSNKHTQARVYIPKPGEPEPPTTRIRAGDPLDAAPEIVCGNCNSTWMSAIQNRAKPHLIPLFEGRPCVIDAHAQALISAWIAMATMTAEFSNNDEALVGIPQADRDWLMRTQTVPKGWGIWIGKRKVGSQGYRWIHAAFPILDADDLPAVVSDKDRAPNSQTTAFTIGELYFFAFSSLPRIADGWDWRTARRARRRLERIFPQRYLAIFWPPSPMNDRDAIDFGHAFLRYSEDLAKRRGYR